MNLLVGQCKSIIEPGKSLVIDVSMVPCRGRVAFRQYLLNMGLNFTCMPSGYTHNLNIYSGKQCNAPKSDIGHSHHVTINLSEPLLGKGRIIYVDKFYTSIPVAKELIDNKTFICGTLRSNRQELPKDL